MTKNRRIIRKFEVIDYLKRINTLIENGEIGKTFNVRDIKNKLDIDRIDAILKKAQLCDLLANNEKTEIGNDAIKQYSFTTNGLKEIKR